MLLGEQARARRSFGTGMTSSAFSSLQEEASQESQKNKDIAIINKQGRNTLDIVERAFHCHVSILVQKQFMEGRIQSF